MMDAHALARLFGDQHHDNVEQRYPTRGVVANYDGATIQVYIPSFDGGDAKFPISYVGGEFSAGDLILVCKDEADSYWLVGTQYPPVQASSGTSGGGTNAAGGGSSLGGGPGSLPSKGMSELNAKQQGFAKTLQGDIGLEPAVICGWVHAEEPASASSAPNGENNWLNVGAFDAGGWAGGGSNVWDSPQKGGHATASFILGSKPVGGITSPLKASSGIQAIAGLAGKSVAAQISGIQGSGWASSGYPSLAADVALFR